MPKTSLLPIVTTDRENTVRQGHLGPKPRKSEKATKLHQAVIKADYGRLTELLQQPPSPPRHLSILKKTGDNNSLDINDRDELGWTALHWAVRKNDPRSVEILLDDRRTDRFPRDKDGRTPLHQAAIYDWGEGIEMLLQKDKNGSTTPKPSDIIIPDNRGRTALHWSAEYGHETVTEKLANQSGCEAIDENKNTALHRAAQRGYIEVVKILAKNGVDLGPENKEKETPFEVAAKNGYEKLALFFFWNPQLQGHSHSMALNLIERFDLDQDIDRLLKWAAKVGFTDVMQGLLDKKAAYIQGKLINNGRMPLIHAAQNGHEAIIQLLIKKGVDYKADDPGEQTPLSYAAGNGHQATVQFLIEKGAHYKARDSRGQTSLLYAAQNGHQATVQFLIEKGADYKAGDSEGRTPLSYAAENGHQATVQFLIEKGADYKAGDYWGRTPLSYAVENGHQATVQFLIEKGAHYKAGDSRGLTPLSYAAQNGHQATVQFLIEKGADYKVDYS